MKQIRYLTYLILGIMLCFVAGCDDSPSDSGESKRKGAGSVKERSLLALFPQKIDDSGWNQSGFFGVKALSTEFGLSLYYLESVQFKDFNVFLSQISSEIQENEIDIVMAHGGQFVQPMTKLAQKFPRVNFVVNTNCPGNNANMGCLSFNWGELGLLSGAVAALKSESGKIGFIGGMKLPILQEMARGMKVAAQQVNPEIELYEAYLGDWTNDEEAIQVADHMIKNGVDVITTRADPASRAIYSLLEEQGVSIIGGQLENYEEQPANLLANVQFNTQRLIQFGFNQMLSGHWEGKLHQFGISDQVQQIVINKSALDQEQLKRYQAIYHQVMSRTLEVE
jgi:basic membrane lipoprotein Med (substrate-binding protein (PBP1-ABC) superfamily)